MQLSLEEKLSPQSQQEQILTHQHKVSMLNIVHLDLKKAIKELIRIRHALKYP